MSEELIEDPVFQYRLRLNEQDGVLRGEFWVEPDGGGAIDHIHPTVEERFEILEGEFTFWVKGRKQPAGPGDRLTVPPGTRHSFRNTGSETGHLICEMEPPVDMRGLFEDSAALARDGKWRRLGRRGVPTGPRALLDMAEFMDRYRDTAVMASPPPFLQSLLVPRLARLARRRRSGGRA